MVDNRLETRTTVAGKEKMTNDSIHRVQHTWHRAIAVGPLFAGMFHENLQLVSERVTPDPSLSEAQCETRFVSVFGRMVNSFTSATGVAPTFQEFKTLYACRAPAAECLDDFWRALTLTLSQLLAQDFCEDTQRAWMDARAALGSAASA